jgi:Fe-S-cluster containining protein
MNLSPHIDPIECQTCALCCKWFTIGYPKSFITSKDPGETRCFSEVQRFLDLESGGKIFVLEYPEEFSVVFAYPCKHLVKQDGQYSCAIYNNGRPQLCEEFPYKPKDCEKYVPPIAKFTDSEAFLKRVEVLRAQL